METPKTNEGYFHRVNAEEETRIYSDLYTLSRVSVYDRKQFSFVACNIAHLIFFVSGVAFNICE